MLMQTVNKCNKQKIVNQPWVNKDCSVKRKQYHRATCYNWRVRTVESKLNLRDRPFNLTGQHES